MNRWEAFTKATVVCSAFLAAGSQIYLNSLKNGNWVWISAFIVFLLIFFAARLIGLRIAALIYFFFYLSRGLIYFATNHVISYNPITVALLALILSTIDFRSWRLPAGWKFPIVYWALVIALSWPIVLLRELDFRPYLTLHSTVFNNSRNLPAQVAADWIAAT
ncbi:MAG: hypothetical protein C5B54_07120, partial [Acidobacteria bacterium]